MPISITANDVANYFIKYFHEHGDPISNLKLQKLLYYAQAWYLALYNKPIFNEPLEAWVHGPVVPEVYRRFKKHTHQPIVVSPHIKKLNKKTTDHLDEIIQVYGGYAAFELENLTHQSDPWKKARGDLPIDAPSRTVISMEEMKHYYAKKAKENKN